MHAVSKKISLKAEKLGQIGIKQILSIQPWI